MATALRRNDTLKGLYLEENDIGEAGSRQLQAVQETTASCKIMACNLQLAVMMGLNSRLGVNCPLFQLDTYICREILALCDVRRPRDILYYPKVDSVEAPP